MSFFVFVYKCFFFSKMSFFKCFFFFKKIKKNLKKNKSRSKKKYDPDRWGKLGFVCRFMLLEKDWIFFGLLSSVFAIFSLVLLDFPLLLSRLFGSFFSFRFMLFLCFLLYAVSPQAPYPPLPSRKNNGVMFDAFIFVLFYDIPSCSSAARLSATQKM